MESVLAQIILYYKKRNVTNDIAHAYSELLETELQNRYFSGAFRSSETHAVSGRQTNMTGLMTLLFRDLFKIG